MNTEIKYLKWSVICFLLISCTESRKGIVSDLEEFKEAVANAQPGDEIIMANGIWENVELLFEGEGTNEKPIFLKAETPGKVIISGQSNLRIAGEYLDVSGLVFKNGFTPTSEVISFRKNKENLAYNSRIHNCVIDNFNNPERFDADFWVMIYGRNNRFDHNTLIGKRNQGVTMAVRLNAPENQENNHIIEYNYFGPRQILGSNGGETLRIGTSHFSRTYSNTLVRKNYFDRCNGEHEIISNKSCGNEFRDNVFFESQGTLTMRHGHHTLVENNYFLGNRKPNTGGIRIINEYQTVQKNYLYGLTGHRFRGALVIMNGVPNSPINRYNQVIDSKMNNNLVIDSDYIQLCAGSDEERSAIPIGSTFLNNAILGKDNLTPFTIYDDVSGIEFNGNLMNEEAELPFKDGFDKVEYQLTKNSNGLLQPNSDVLNIVGLSELRLPVTKEETGADFYPKNDIEIAFRTGKITKVEQGEGSLFLAIQNAEAGDVLMLEEGGTYLLRKYSYIKSQITIMTEGNAKATVLSEKSSFFRIENGGAIELENITIDGAESPDQPGNNVISTSKYAMNQNYKVFVKNCTIKDLVVNHSFDFLKTYKHTFAESVLFLNSDFTNISGSIISMTTETEDLGIYNVENIDMHKCSFSDVQGIVMDVYRGGTDESTFGPIINIVDSKFSNSGKGKRNRAKASLKFHGVQKLNVKGCIWEDTAPLKLYLTNGEPITNIEDCSFKNTGEIIANNEGYHTSNIIYQN